MSDYQKKLALELEIARAIPGASEAIIKRVYQNRVAVLSGYDLHEDGSITSIGGGSIKDEIEAMRQSGACDDLFDEKQPAAPVKEAVADKRPGALNAEDYKHLPHEARLFDMMNQPAPEKKKANPVPPFAGLSPEAVAKLSPEEKVAAANEAAAKRDGWAFDGRGGRF